MNLMPSEANRLVWPHQIPQISKVSKLFGIPLETVFHFVSKKVWELGIGGVFSAV